MVDDLGVKMVLTFRGATRHMQRSTVTRTVSQQLMRTKRVCGIPGGHGGDKHICRKRKKRSVRRIDL